MHIHVDANSSPLFVCCLFVVCLLFVCLLIGKNDSKTQ